MPMEMVNLTTITTTTMAMNQPEISILKTMETILIILVKVKLNLVSTDRYLISLPYLRL